MTWLLTAGDYNPPGAFGAQYPAHLTRHESLRAALYWLDMVQGYDMPWCCLAPIPTRDGVSPARRSDGRTVCGHTARA